MFRSKPKGIPKSRLYKQKAPEEFRLSASIEHPLSFALQMQTSYVTRHSPPTIALHPLTSMLVLFGDVAVTLSTAVGTVQQ